MTWYILLSFVPIHRRGNTVRGQRARTDCDGYSGGDRYLDCDRYPETNTLPSSPGTDVRFENARCLRRENMNRARLKEKMVDRARPVSGYDF